MADWEDQGSLKRVACRLAEASSHTTVRRAPFLMSRRSHAHTAACLGRGVST